jgi:hypothetical protein
VDVFGFVLIGIGAALWNTIAIDTLAGGIFRAQAGHRMRNGGPPPWFMVTTSPYFGSDDNYKTGTTGLITGIGKACAGAVMFGAMVWLASRDWHLWGETLSILGKSSTPYLEVVGMFVTSTAAGSIYVSFRFARELHLPAKQEVEPRMRGRDPRSAPSRTRGRLLIAGGVILSVACLVLAVYLTIDGLFISPPPYVEVIPAIVLLSGPVYTAGQNLVRRGRRHFVTVLSSHEQLDDFVLYLRWFKEDPFLDRAFPRVGSPFLFHLLISGASEEEQLVKLLKPYGRVVTVGDPTEALPRIGADRFYLPVEGWHEPVRELMAKARLVVLSLGMGEGTLWELVEAMSTLPPDRLILLVPMNEDDYEAFRREAHRRLPDRRRLPEYQSDGRSRRRSLSEGHRAALMKTRDDSYLTTIAEGISAGTAMSRNSQIESVFQAVVHFPSWDAPVFTRLDTAMPVADRPSLFRHPRAVALENGLRPALRRSRS